MTKEKKPLTRINAEGNRELDPELAKTIDKVVSSDINESNWRSMANELELSAIDLSDSINNESDAVERCEIRRAYYTYVADIRNFVRAAVEAGRINELQEEATVQEMLARPIMTEITF